DAAGLKDAFHHAAGEVNRHGETNSLIATSATKDGGVEADEPAFGINQRAAGISGIDGGVGLDEVLDVFDAEPTASDRAGNAHGYGLADAEGIADRHYHVADLQVIAVAHDDG